MASPASPGRSSGKARYSLMTDIMSQGDDEAFDQYMSQLKAASPPTPGDDDEVLMGKAFMALYAHQQTEAARQSSPCSSPKSGMRKAWNSSPKLLDMARKVCSFLGSSKERPRTPLRATTMRAPSSASTSSSDSQETVRQVERDHPSAASSPGAARQPQDARASHDAAPSPARNRDARPPPSPLARPASPLASPLLTMKRSVSLPEFEHVLDARPPPSPARSTLRKPQGCNQHPLLGCSPPAASLAPTMRRNVSWSHIQEVLIIPANGDPYCRGV